MSKMQLIQAEVCPYAQRTHMCLLEKQLDFEVIEVDLKNKPAWFEEISPYSKVPVLKDENIRLYESTIINEYLDEVYQDPPLMPEVSGDRAMARTWIDFDNVKFVPAFYQVLLEQDLDKRQGIADDLVEQMQFMESQGFSKDANGPYWFGEKISLVDLAIYPHFERIGVLEAYRNISIPQSCSRLREWLAAMLERPSAKATAHDNNYHVDAYSHYADGTASGTTAKDMRR